MAETMRERFCPECRWTVVTDQAGRRRLEMRWVPLGAAATHGPVARAA
ncbi:MULTISPECIES: hypothetical protein [unclassified Blastococcus]|nr:MULTISPECIES: hypothetical protein [unclassified Blastococcus]